MKPIKTYELHWKKLFPPIVPKQYRRFIRERDPTEEEYEHSQILNIPPSTLAWLEAAFKQNLTRDTGWEHPGFDPGFFAAAEIYKRGVGAKSIQQPALTQRQTSGIQKLYLVDHPDFQQYDHEQTLIIVDEMVLEKWSHYFLNLKNTCIIPGTEQQKSLQSLVAFCQKASKYSATRWIVVGGGSLTDLVGFAAYLHQKSVDFYPTTLLAMVDASIGGKTGINYPPYGKNQVGAFYFADSINIVPQFITTLNKQQILDGLAEMAKHALLDPQKHLAHLMLHDPPQKLIWDALLVKLKFVSQDPMEQGKRRWLNLGHTLAHALEKAAADYNVPLTHGSAVAIGLVFAINCEPVSHLQRQEMLSFLEKVQLTNYAQQTLTQLIKQISPDSLLKSVLLGLKYDKKSTNQELQWLIPVDFGKIKERPISEKQFINQWKSLLAYFNLDSS